MKTIKKIDYKKVVRTEGFPLFLYNTVGERRLIELEKNSVKATNRFIRAFKSRFISFYNTLSLKLEDA